jgi:eukaryotic-like serine/threonine-protein kinase
MAVAAGTRLGPYEVIELLGAGGMGVVYRARDCRLGREVALKVLPEHVALDADRLRRFEREARAVAALNHPHVLTVHDVGTHEGAPYVVTELLEGANLRDLMGVEPVSAREALGWAQQAAQGLAAAHQKGVVHRDLKPENLFLTTDGRLKILDFGLAKQGGAGSGAATESHPTGPGAVMGTLAYMSPEQVKALAVDARSDLFSLGVVLYELLARRHPFRRETAAATLGAILQETPPPLFGLDATVPRAVDAIVRRCLEKRREDRFQSAHDLGLALEAVLAGPTRSPALEDLEERRPYPGLSSFTERDAAVFFGREEEVKALWARIRSRKLLAVIGPSGVGKTSFLRAGLAASRLEGWAVAHATPGANPGLGLAQALMPDLVGDAEAMNQILSGVGELAATGEAGRLVAAAARWRSRHVEALLEIDQFEELFTLNTPESQARVAQLVRRLVSEADVHVVLSMRDDFLIRCSEHEALLPVFESLTPLAALAPEGLRRAVIEPARARGYRFEDEALVDEIVSAVAGARGALPLLAFAVSRLWDSRDAQRKLLTREAYEAVGGVGGALAQHAEATLERIGGKHQRLVREIFRNLVAAQGTRAVADREELLSAFPARAAAEEVLGQLVDGRLLTSYETEARAGEPGRRRVEIVHESLLETWPRLVRWRTQDEDGAQLRDQLRQAARLWEARGRTRDLLWSGATYQELELWRGRYPGALTAVEESFARATRERALRRRRVAVGLAVGAVVVSAAVAVAIGVSRNRALAAADRAEASKLMALAELNLAVDPTQALAYATASLALQDAREARLLALRAVQRAPPAWEIPSGSDEMRWPAFSPDGRRLAVGSQSSFVGVWEDGGRPPLRLPGHEILGGNQAHWASPDLLVTGTQNGRQVHVWRLPGGARVRTIDFGAATHWQVGHDRLLTETAELSPGAAVARSWLLRSWRLPEGEPEPLGRLVDSFSPGAGGGPMGYTYWFEPHGRALLHVRGGTVRVATLPLGRERDRVLDEAQGQAFLTFPARPHLLDVGAAAENRLVLFPESGPPATTTIPRPATAPPTVKAEASGRWVQGEPKTDSRVRLWDTRALPGARPLELLREGSWYWSFDDFTPDGRVVVAATGTQTRLTFWPLPSRPVSIVEGYTSSWHPVAFSPDGRWLATSWANAQLRLWPVPGRGEAQVRVLSANWPAAVWCSLRFDPQGRYLFAVGGSEAWVVPVDGSLVRKLPLAPNSMYFQVAVSPSGRFLATAPGYAQGPKKLAVFEVETGARRLFDLPMPQPAGGAAPTGHDGAVGWLEFTDDSTLYTAGDGGVRRWNLESGTSQLVRANAPGEAATLSASPERAEVYVCVTKGGGAQGPPSGSSCEVIDARTGRTRSLDFAGEAPGAFLPQGNAALTAYSDGSKRVGRRSGSQGQLLLEPAGGVEFAALSPDGQWLATTGEDNVLRLVPMPDLDAPPLDLLPRDELVAKLRALTNLRAVPDPKSSTGWTIELGPFPGWSRLPEW